MILPDDFDLWLGQIRRRLADGRQASIEALTFGRGRICVGEWDAGWYRDGY
jgi:hypothetical protein